MMDATLADVYRWFGNGPGGFKNLAEFRKEWELLSEVDRKNLKTGIGDGSLTY